MESELDGWNREGFLHDFEILAGISSDLKQRYLESEDRDVK